MTQYQILVRELLNDGATETIADVTVRSGGLAPSTLRSIAEEIEPTKPVTRSSGLAGIFEAADRLQRAQGVPE